MTKLFNKFLTICVAAFSAFSLSACSDKIAGTAEEPNQFAYGTQSSSSTDRSIESDSGKSLETPNVFPIITSSASSVPSPTTNNSSSSQSEYDGFVPITIDPTPSLSDSVPGNSGAGSSGGAPSFGNPDCHCPNAIAVQTGRLHTRLTTISKITISPMSLTTTTSLPLTRLTMVSSKTSTTLRK